jgi:signal transduction histidine kinase
VAERRLRWPGTVRWRVTLLATLAVVLVLVATAAVLVVVQRRVLIDQLDETLAADARRMITALQDGQEPLLQPATDDDAMAQVVTVDGTVVAASPGYRDADDSYRHVSRRFTAGGRELSVHVAAPLDDVDESVGALVATLAIIIPAATAILAALVWMLVGRTLRPVERMRAEVSGIGLRELDRRVPQPPGRDEIARLATTMNEMLDRLDVSSQQQQQFVADASHELRTPLARIRSELELAQREGDAADHDVVASLLEEVEGLQLLTEDLLVLAQLDTGAPARAGRPVDLDDVVLEAARAVETRGRSLDTRQVSAAQVVGHRDQLRRVVGNLLDNAVRHAAATVTLSLAETDSVVTLAVTDDGPGIPAERRADVFERFRRVDEARGVGRGGTGLGLAIARDLVERHGGTITVDPDYNAGARFVVTLPATVTP